MGHWIRSAGTHPITITYYIEGTELLLQFNYEPVKAFDYRMKQLRFTYKLEGDVLSLTRDGVTTRFQRIRADDKVEDSLWDRAARDREDVQRFRTQGQ